MTLEQTLGKLIERKPDGSRKGFNPTYNSDAFYELHEGLDTLGNLKIGTPEGVRNYRNITGETPFPQDTPTRMGTRRDAWVNGGSEDLFSYSSTHFGSVINEITDEETQIRLSLGFCPETSSADKKYEAARSAIHQATKTLKEIENNPMKFFSEEMKRAGYDKNSKAAIEYMSLAAGDYLGIVGKEEEERRNLAVGSYGARQFLTATKTHYDEQAKGLKTEGEKIQNEVRDKIAQEQRNKGGLLTPDESAKITGEGEKKLDELAKKYGDARNSDKFTRSCAITALDYLRRKREGKNKTKKSP